MQNFNLLNIASLSLAGLLASACLPAHLQKYRRDQAQKQAPQQPASDIDSSNSVAASRGAPTTIKPAAPPQAKIYAIDEQTFRFQLSDPNVWESALNVLLKNYNLTIVDRQNGIITTEWDTYYLNNIVYRNKVSLRLKKTYGGHVDVVIHNAVERLQDGAGGIGAVWLPTEDNNSEVHRLIQNMAISLNEAPPQFPANIAGQERDELKGY